MKATQLELLPLPATGYGIPILGLHIPLSPRAAPRPRAVARVGRVGVRSPQEYEAWKEDFATLVRNARRGGQPLLLPLVVSVVAVFARPKRQPQHHVGDAELPMPAWPDDGRAWHTTRPDADNIEKAVLDACKLAGVIADDSIICETRIRKVYAAPGEAPCIELRIYAAGLLP